MNESEAPKYLTVKKNIIHNINDNVFHTGELIPSERELVEMYHVSRITVRKALSELQNEGYLYKVQGKGTYVKGKDSRQNLFSLTSCTQDIIRLGMTPSRKVIFSGIISADKTCQQALNLKKEEFVYSLKRIYYADQEPINYTETFLSYKYLKEIEHFDFSKASLYEVLENKYNIKITRSVRTIEAVAASQKVSDMLSVDVGVPLLLFRCITYGKVNSKEIPIETFRCYYRSDHFSFFINQVRD